MAVLLGAGWVGAELLQLGYGLRVAGVIERGWPGWGRAGGSARSLHFYIEKDRRGP